jgi:prevent-host-death family protein
MIRLAGLFFMLKNCALRATILLCSNVTTLVEARMTITKINSRTFNQEVSGAKKAAEAGPVYITDRGKPAHVLLTYDDYKKLAGTPKANPAVIAWAKAIDAEDMFISALTLMEIEKGILKFARKDPLQARHLQRWYQEQVLMEFARRTFDIDSAMCGILRVWA